jgi:chemotaxis protein CheX
MPATTIILPPVLDLKAASVLKSEIDAHTGAALEIDVSQVERVGGQCLQVLLAASDAWRASGLPFQLVRPADAARNDFWLLGATHLLPGAEAC